MITLEPHSIQPLALRQTESTDSARHVFGPLRVVHSRDSSLAEIGFSLIWLRPSTTVMRASGSAAAIRPRERCCQAFTFSSRGRKQRADRERRLEALAVEVLTALGERAGAVQDVELRAGGALLAMSHDEGLSVREAVSRGQFSHSPPLQ